MYKGFGCGCSRWGFGCIRGSGNRMDEWLGNGDVDVLDEKTGARGQTNDIRRQMQTHQTSGIEHAYLQRYRERGVAASHDFSRQWARSESETQSQRPNSGIRAFIFIFIFIFINGYYQWQSLYSTLLLSILSYPQPKKPKKTNYPKKNQSQWKKDGGYLSTFRCRGGGFRCCMCVCVGV